MELGEAFDEDLSPPTPRDSTEIVTFSKYEKSEIVGKPLFEEDQSNKDGLKPEVEELSTRNAVSFLLDGSLKYKVCRYCLNETSDLTDLDEIFEVAHCGSVYKIALKDMVASFHPFKVADDLNLPNKVCNKCIDRTISSYLFAQQCERSERALRNCFEDLYEKVNKLDSLDVEKKRGRQKLNPNYNKLHTENEKVIDYAEPLFHLVNTIDTQVDRENSNQFECYKCFEILPDLVSLLNHNKSHPKSMWFNCRFCGQSFPKMNQLKRHFRTGHPSTEVNEKPFRCSTCDISCETYKEFLEHKERHKFKNVMEHLIERKIHRLCAICLNQSNEMSSLNEIVCIHGGNADISGNKPLHSILSSSIPEKMNKYRELLLPKRATIIRFIDKPQQNTDFVFPKPDILAKDEKELECYLFSFSKPEYGTINENNKANENKDTQSRDSNSDEHEYNNNIMNDEKNEVNIMKRPLEVMDKDVNAKRCKKLSAKAEIDEINEDDGKEIEKEENMDPKEILGNDKTETNEDKERKSTENVVMNKENEQNINNIDIENISRISVGSESIYAAYNVNNTRKTEGIDKESWIFDKTLKNVDYKINIKKEITDKHCNVCWVFKNVDARKCDSCKKLNDSNDACESKPVITDELKYDKTLDEWQCRVCFVNNKGDRNTCQCCENDKSLKVEKIFNFNKTSCYFEHKPIENLRDDNIELAQEDNVISNHAEIAPNPQLNENIELSTSSIQPITYMDTETVEEINIIDSKPIQCHAMDIEDGPETILYYPNNRPKEILNNIPNGSFVNQFNNITNIENESATHMNLPNDRIDQISTDITHEPIQISSVASCSNFKFQFSIGSSDKSDKSTQKKKRQYLYKNRASHK